MAKINFDQTFVAIGAIIQREGKILLVKESDGPNKDKWNLPGGSWEKDETLIEGVKREVKEETGFDFEPTSILGIFSRFRHRPSLSITAMEVLFIGDIFGKPEDLSEDITETKFFTPNEIYNMDKKELYGLYIIEAVRNFTEGKKYPIEMINHSEITEPDFKDDGL